MLLQVAPCLPACLLAGCKATRLNVSGCETANTRLNRGGVCVCVVAFRGSRKLGDLYQEEDKKDEKKTRTSFWLR